jgi:glycosyltransferase involved in cell wall biosynthesis
VKCKLAIIIPAYKRRFLEETLESLANQSCRNFNVYIGDDNSPHQLKEIVDRFVDRLNILYHRFEENIGADNLIRQWERCVRLMNGEEFFCLFSDDDLMQSQNIERFYRMLKQKEPYDVYRFDIDIINESNQLLKACAPYPPLLSSSDFFYLLYTYQIDARMPEFIFRTNHFHQHDGFVSFDLAYRSDNATVMVMARDRGIRTIPESKVWWRDSGVNISSNREILLMKRKVLATIHFFNWLNKAFIKEKTDCALSPQERLELIIREVLSLYPALPERELYSTYRLYLKHKRIGFQLYGIICFISKLRLIKKGKVAFPV